MRLIRPLLAASLLSTATLAAQRPVSDTSLTVDAIFRRGEFRSAPLPDVHWLKDGHSYLDLAANARGGTDIVRVDVLTGAKQVIADAKSVVDEKGQPIEIEEISLSDDESKALLFHNSVRVWRDNTRGVFHVLDFTTGKTTPIATVVDRDTPASRADTTAQPALGKSNLPSFIAAPLRGGLQMFAKFSPDGKKVAFVSDNDLYVTDLVARTTRRMTTDGSADIINGTTDWVYEEELGLRDAFRWSPDSKRIAYWRFDQSAVPAFPLVDELTLYPTVSVLRYPKAGEPNSRVRVGVMDVATARTTWLQTGADTGIYVARMDWVGNDSLVVHRLPRRQDRVDLLMASAATGGARTIMTDRDSAYVDVQDVPWLANGRQFLLLSDRSGWRQIWLHDRSGRAVRQLTQNGMDVLEILRVDEPRGEVYFVAAAPNPTQRQVYAASLKRAAVRRVTTEPGAHALNVAPGARWAVDFHSTANSAPVVTLYELPAYTRRRVLVDNAQLNARLAASGVRTEFFQIPMPDGTKLDAMRTVAASFDSSAKHPVLMYVYGGPAAPTVNDQFGGSRMLWHMLLAQRGYVVVSVDNRGAAWRGRDFRKITQLHLGRYEARDQIDAARWLARQQWVDGGRIGMWGWSYGGYLTSLTTMLGGDVFRAALAVAPVTDWRLYDSIYTERMMWIPQENKGGYDESAPQSHVAGLTARFMLVFGTGDDNVHPQNSIQLANRLEAAQKPFQMLLYPNRTHSISGGNTQAHLYDAFTRFIRENL
ncbi:MAG TPA: S9 family peptidase [Gemmatimonadaceae bacterium]|nr:S9 family peptidase [Gemmatimonadaceae bacterium]